MANARRIKKQVKALETKEDSRVDLLIDALRAAAAQLDADTGVANTNYVALLADIKKTNEQ